MVGQWVSGAGRRSVSFAGLRTHHPLARYAGVKEAARRAHDERIGIGRAFHLFRLPETIERRLFDAMGDRSISDAVFACTASRPSAATTLSGFVDVSPNALEGPLKIGKAEDLTSNHWVSAVAGAYRSAFDAGFKCFPYLTET